MTDAAPVQPAATRRSAIQRREVGGPEGIRTPDLLNAIQARSQLRHWPTWDGTTASRRRGRLAPEFSIVAQQPPRGKAKALPCRSGAALPSVRREHPLNLGRILISSSAVSRPPTVRNRSAGSDEAHSWRRLRRLSGLRDGRRVAAEHEDDERRAYRHPTRKKRKHARHYNAAGGF
jgi:hypothetical protein